MDLTNSYYKKYLKYKTKYIKLQKQINNKTTNSLNTYNSLNTNNFSNINNLNKDNLNKDNLNKDNKIGGGYFYEQNDLIKRTNMMMEKKFSKDLYKFSSIYLKANLINREIIKKYSKIRKTILKNNSFPPHNYHLTLLIFEINFQANQKNFLSLKIH
jgi:hypothetical protein